MSRSSRYLTALFLALAAGLVFIPSLWSGFVWDDDLYVTGNPFIRSLGPGFFRWAATAVVSANWHPLTLLSHAVDYAVWGMDPRGHHLTSLIFHALNTALVFFLASALVERGSGDAPAWKAYFVGITTALLFGLHPLRVESVAWVSERKDLLCAFFYIGSLIAYLGYAKARRSVFHYCASLFLFVLALMSKPMAVSLPVVLLILDFFLLKRRAILEKVPFFVLAGAASAVTLLVQGSGEAVRTFAEVPFAGRISIAIKAYAFYIWKTLFPVNLSPLYPLPREGEYFNLAFFVSLILVLAITVYLVSWARKYLPAWLYYLVTLLPVVGIVQVGSQSAADRYTYLPGLGLYMPLGLLAYFLSARLRGSRARAALAATLVFVFALLAMKTVRQQAVWRDPISLWSRVATLYPERAPVGVFNNRGLAYKEAGDYAKAVKDFTRAMEIDPGYAPAYNNRGLVFLEAGELRRAIADFDRAISIDPGFMHPYVNRGLAFDALGDFRSAVEDFTTVLSQRPHADVYLYRGAAYVKMGSFREAIGDLTKAAELDPRDPGVYYNLGVAYRGLGEEAAARENFEKASALGYSLRQAPFRASKP